jgi:hypothetical protein
MATRLFLGGGECGAGGVWMVVVGGVNRREMRDGG